MSETAQQGIEIKLGDGAVIKGANLEDALANAQKIIEDRGDGYREQKARADAAEAEATRLRQEAEARQAPPEPAPQTAANAYSPDRYYELLNSDPIAAQNYLDQQRFGTSDPVGELNYLRNKLDSLALSSTQRWATQQHDIL